MRSVVLIAVLFLLPALALAAGPRVELIVGEKAPPLERKAADEIASVLQRLYNAEVKIAPTAADRAEHVIFVGSPRTNSNMEPLAKAWPKLSEQGHALKTVELGGRPALLVGGGSPAATYWAASEYAHRLGVRSLLYGDLDPIASPEFSLANYDAVLEPRLKSRAWHVLGRYPNNMSSWGLADQKKLLGQLAKLKCNRVILEVLPWQPFVDFESDGIKKQTGVLWYGWQFPVSGDTAGRAAFGGAKLFEHPDFASLERYEDRAAAGQKFIRGLIAEAHGLGMTVSLSLCPLEFPREFARAIPDVRAIAGEYDLAVGPGEKHPADDEKLLALAKAQLDAYRRAYPDVDAIDFARVKSSLLPLAKRLLPDAGQAVPADDLASTSVLPRAIEIPNIEASGYIVGPTSDGDLDLLAYQLSRQSFDAAMTPQAAVEGLVTTVCGDEVSSRVSKAVTLVEEATQLANQHDPAFGVPAPDMILKQLAVDEAVPEWWGKSRDYYLNAMNEMYRANSRARDGGRSYTLYLARRYEFGFEYMNCVEAVRKAGIAKRKGDKDAQIAELEKAIESMYGGLNALAAVSRSQSDRGTIALLNEFGYRALQKELAAADEAGAK